MMRIRVLFNQERLFLTSPEAIKEVTVTRTYDFEKPPQAGYIFRKLLGNGVLIAEGAEHQVRLLGHTRCDFVTDLFESVNAKL